MIADGAAMPFRDRCADLVCFAQSWHWLDVDRRSAEAARVLRSDGRWAAWWSHARADDEPWLRRVLGPYGASDRGRARIHRDVDWGDRLRGEGSFDVGDRVVVPWERDATVEDRLTEERSKTYVARLPEPERTALLRSTRPSSASASPTDGCASPTRPGSGSAHPLPQRRTASM